MPFEHAKMIAYSTVKHALTNLELSCDFQPTRFSEFEIFLALFIRDKFINVTKNRY